MPAYDHGRNGGPSARPAGRPLSASRASAIEGGTDARDDRSWRDLHDRCLRRPEAGPLPGRVGSTRRLDRLRPCQRDRRHVGRGQLPRAQAASLLARTLEYTTGRPLVDGPSYFRDVGGTHGLRIRQITRAGLVAGDGRLGFDPAGTLSRAQPATFSIRLLAAIDLAR
jgi:hypothetical protein